MKQRKEDSQNHLSTMDINTNVSFLHLLQIHDSGFPTGAFAHSFGMETYIQNNIISTVDDLKLFCESYIKNNLASTDALIVKKAYELSLTNDLAGLIELERICNGVKLSSESRKSSSMLGRQFMNMISQLHDFELLKQWNDKLDNNEIQGHYAVIYGLYTALLGIKKHVSIGTFLYSSIVTLVQNAVRSVPLGQKGGIETTFSLLPLIEEVTNGVIQKDIEDINTNAIGFEIASMKHEFLYTRLFIS